MRRNSTLNFWELFLKKKDSNSNLVCCKFDLDGQLQPSKKTVDKVIAYSCSIKGIKMKSGEKILISLN